MIHDGTVVAYGLGLIITQEHIRQMKGNKCNGYVIMDPRDFLDLTTSSSTERKRVMSETNTVAQYNEWARNGQNILPPWLDIETKKPPVGKVTGHEGRHRAAALIKEQTYKMPVFLVLKIMGYAEWRLSKFPNDQQKRFDYRYVDAKDFPQYALGQYMPYRVELPFDTWVQLR